MSRERADATRNRQLLVANAREMLAECGADRLTMDALAERAGLGKGTVFRRFGTRSGIFRALLDESERSFQEQVMSGPPPLGPGAEPLDRLTAFGRARIRFLLDHREVARAALDGRTELPSGPPAAMVQTHIRMLLRQLSIDAADLDVLAMQLTAALDLPLLLYVPWGDDAPSDEAMADRLSRGWEDLIRRLAR